MTSNASLNKAAIKFVCKVFFIYFIRKSNEISYSSSIKITINIMAVFNIFINYVQELKSPNLSHWMRQGFLIIGFYF